MTEVKAALRMLAAVSVLATGAPVFAQGISPFGRYSATEHITTEDRRIMESLSAKLYQADNPQIGATEHWSNPKSGNSGTVSLIEVFEKDGMPCRKMRHRITIKGMKDPMIFVFNRCRLQSGEWKVM